MATSAPPPPLRITFTLIEGDDEFAQRTLLLDPESDVTLGRSSKDTTKQLIATVENLWLQSPVVSRKHARLAYQSLDGQDPKLTIEDIGSSHGTYIGDEVCHQHTLYPVRDGDILKFGADVIRGEDSFAPPSFRVNIQTMPPKAVAVPAIAVHSYALPEEWSDFSSLAPSSTESHDGDALGGASQDSSDEDDDDQPGSDMASSASQHLARILTDNVVESMCLTSDTNAGDAPDSEQQSSSPTRRLASESSLQSFLNAHTAYLDLPRLYPGHISHTAPFDDPCPYPEPTSHPDELPPCGSCNPHITTNADERLTESSKFQRSDWSSMVFAPSDNIHPTTNTTRGNIVKNGISIESLINLPEPSSTGKRKFSEMNENESPPIEQKTEVLVEVEKLVIESPQDAAEVNSSPVVEGPARKRSRMGDVAFGLTCFIAGGISAVGALASLPETFFS